MPNYDAIIFDMDGTLMDTEHLWEVAEGNMFTDRGLVYTDEARQQVLGLRLDEFFEKLIEIYNLDESVDSLVDELIERMLVLVPQEAKAKPYATEIIEWTVEQGLPHCIASSSPLSIIDACVASQGWDEIMPLRFSADQVAKGKPAPDVYLHSAQALGVDPTKCLAIEDSPAGAKAAVAAGMTTFIVPDFHTPKERMQSISPHIFDNLQDILTHLKNK